MTLAQLRPIIQRLAEEATATNGPLVCGEDCSSCQAVADIRALLLDRQQLLDVAQRFAEAWAVWSVSPAVFPDDDTIEAAGALLELLGVDQPDEEAELDPTVHEDGTPCSYPGFITHEYLELCDAEAAARRAKATG